VFRCFWLAPTETYFFTMNRLRPFLAGGSMKQELRPHAGGLSNVRRLTPSSSAKLSLRPVLWPLSSSAPRAGLCSSRTTSTTSWRSGAIANSARNQTLGRRNKAFIEGRGASRTARPRPLVIVKLPAAGGHDRAADAGESKHSSARVRRPVTAIVVTLSRLPLRATDRNCYAQPAAA
jgi:hypothetical protein